LHGISKDELDLAHINNYNNLYPNKKCYTQVHGNCLLTVNKLDDYQDDLTKEIQEYSEFKTFKRGLFRTYCAVRGTWHSYNLLNEKIDECLKKLSMDINDDIKDIDKAEYTKQNILLKNLFQFINSEDPYVRGIGLTPFVDIYSESMKIYKSDEIKNNIRNKLKDYDKLIEAINNYKYYKNISNDNKSINSKWWLIALFSIIFSLSSYFAYCMISKNPDIGIILIIIAVGSFLFVIWRLFKLFKN